jgi:competence protein ComEC
MLFVCGMFAWLMVPGSLWPADREVRMLPVGDGMSMLIRGPGASVLVDGGRAPRDAVRALAALRMRTVDAVLVTHADADHIGGVGRVLEWLRPGRLILPRHVADHAEIVGLRRLARRVGVAEHLVAAGERLHVGSLALDVLWPAAEFRGDDNDASLVCAVTSGTVRVLVTGDIEAAGERALMAAPGPLLATVLQLPHHGSRTSSTAGFLAAVDPVVALAATGERPRCRYPHADTLRRLRERGVVLVAQPEGSRTVSIADDWLVVGTRTPVRVRVAGRRE